MRLPLSICSLLLIALPAFGADDDGEAFFEKKIRPMLVKHCYECHSAKSESLKAGLLVDSAPGLLEGGDSGAAIVEGKPDESLLIEGLKYESIEMPPAGKLPDNVVTSDVKAGLHINRHPIYRTCLKVWARKSNFLFPC